MAWPCAAHAKSLAKGCAWWREPSGARGSSLFLRVLCAAVPCCKSLFFDHVVSRRELSAAESATCKIVWASGARLAFAVGRAERGRRSTVSMLRGGNNALCGLGQHRNRSARCDAASGAHRHRLSRHAFHVALQASIVTLCCCLQAQGRLASATLAANSWHLKRRVLVWCCFSEVMGSYAPLCASLGACVYVCVHWCPSALVWYARVPGGGRNAWASSYCV